MAIIARAFFRKGTSMWKWLRRAMSLALVMAVTLSFSLTRSEGQRSSGKTVPGITIFGKEEVKWREKREVPVPMIIGSGVKEGPQAGSLDLREDVMAPTQKMAPPMSHPGCAYRSPHWTGGTPSLKGDKTLYETGRALYLQNDFEKAYQAFQELLANYPGSAWKGSSLYWMGEIRYREGREEEAFSHFYRVVEEHPSNEFYGYALYSCGWIRMEKGAYEEAHRHFHRVYEMRPSDSISESSLFWSGYCLYYLGRYDEALSEARTLLETYPKGKWRPEAEYLSGVGHFRMQRSNEAAEIFRNFLRQYPRHPLEESARYVLGWSLFSLKQYGEARKAFEEILMNYPGSRLSDPVFWAVLRTYLGEGNLEKGTDYYQNFLVHFLPSHWLEQCLYDIGQSYFEQGQYSEALSIFRQFLKTYPESDLEEGVLFMVGECLFNQKDYPSAIATYRRVLEKKRKAELEPLALLRLGYAFFHEKDYVQALNIWEELLSHYPDRPDRGEILYWMTEAALAKQDFHKALGYVEKLKGDEEHFLKGLNSLAWYHYQKGQWKEANLYFLRILKEFPEVPSIASVILLAGQCYLNQGDYEKAKAVLARLDSERFGKEAQEREAQGKARYLLGWIAFRQERFDEAIQRFERLLASDPSGPYGEEARYWIGWSHLRKKDYRRSIDTFQRLAQDSPQSPFAPSALLKIGDAHYNQKKFSLAISSYSKVLQTYPKSKEAPEAEFGILLCLRQEKKFKAFVSGVETFVKKYPQHPLAGQALMDLGDHYQQQGMQQKTLRTYLSLLERYPRSEWAEEVRFRLALLFKGEKRWKEALTELERFSKDYPKSPLLGEVLVEAGEVCFVLKQYEKGIGYLNKALEAHAAPLVAKRAYLGLEEGYRSLRRYDQAEKALKELIAKFPGDDVVFDGQLRLGLLLLSQKRFREAVEPLSQASRSPEERIASQADFKLGEVYQEMGNRELAVAQFSKVVYLYPHRADLGEEALLRLGGLYLEQRKFPEAKLAYRKLLEKTKREDRRELAQKKLAEIEKGKVP